MDNLGVCARKPCHFALRYRRLITIMFDFGDSYHFHYHICGKVSQIQNARGRPMLSLDDTVEIMLSHTPFNYISACCT